MPEDLWRSRGRQECGILCPDCGDDWMWHKDGHCWQIVNSVHGDICECATPIPEGVEIPVIDSHDVLYRHEGGERVGWMLKHRPGTCALFAIRDGDSTYVVENHWDAVKVLHGKRYKNGVPLILGILGVTQYKRPDGSTLDVATVDWAAHATAEARYSFIGGSRE